MTRVLGAVAAAAIVNFVAFVIIAVVIGDAGNGKIENGHYFLASHAGLTEVSAAVFTYSQWHARSLLVTHPLGMIAIGWISLRRKRRQRASP